MTSLAYKTHAMDICRHMHAVVWNFRTHVHECTYCVFLNAWIFLDDTHLYKIVRNNAVQVLSIGDESSIGLYCKDEHIYIIHTYGYTCFNAKTLERYKVSFDRLCLAFSTKYACIYMNNMIYDISTDHLHRFDTSNCCFGVNKDGVYVPVELFKNTLKVNDATYTIPDNVFSEERWYSFEVLNELVIIEMCHHSAKSWYIIFDTDHKLFSQWHYLKSIIDITALTTNQILISYDTYSLILSKKDFLSLFSSKTLSSLILEIERGCESMMYSRDAFSPYCLDKCEKYLYYVSNKNLMTTRTCAPFDMHTLGRLDQKPSMIHVEYNEVFVQYENLDIQIMSI